MNIKVTRTMRVRCVSIEPIILIMGKIIWPFDSIQNPRKIKKTASKDALERLWEKYSLQEKNFFSDQNYNPMGRKLNIGTGNTNNWLGFESDQPFQRKLIFPLIRSWPRVRKAKIRSIQKNFCNCDQNCNPMSRNININMENTNI